MPADVMVSTDIGNINSVANSYALIEQWSKNKGIVLLLGVREQLNNPGLNSLEFAGIKSEAGQHLGQFAAQEVEDGAPHRPQSLERDLKSLAVDGINHGIYHPARSFDMHTAKLFKNGRSQAVRLPAEFRFEGDEVSIRRDPDTGDVILSPRNRKFSDWLKLRDELLPGISATELSALDKLRDPGPSSERDWP